MKKKRVIYEEGFLDCTSSGFGSVRCVGVINHVAVDFILESDEFWYYCFEQDKTNLSVMADEAEHARIKASILGYAILHAEEGAQK